MSNNERKIPDIREENYKEAKTNYNNSKVLSLTLDKYNRGSKERKTRLVSRKEKGDIK